ncbi:hypothetical protein K9M79_08410 [Candidatus Woesearchaeota archaeon]|nr:hypothetical protein [Candidatus Woesearchaeota archaeon]
MRTLSLWTVMLVMVLAIHTVSAAVEIIQLPTIAEAGNNLNVRLNLTNADLFGKRNVEVTLRINDGDNYVQTFNIDIDRKSYVILDRSIEIFKDQEPGVYTFYVDVKEPGDTPMYSSKANFKITRPKYDVMLLIDKLHYLELDKSGFNTKAEMQVSNLDMLNIGKDERKYFTLEITNTGEVEIQDIVVYPEGELSMLLKSDSQKLPSLMPYEKYHLPFYIEMGAGTDFSQGVYSLKMNIISKQTETTSTVQFHVFNSKKEKYNYQINDLENRIFVLADDVDNLENASTSTIEILQEKTNQLKDLLNELSIYLEVENYDKIEILFVESNQLIKETESILEYVEKNPVSNIPFYLNLWFYGVIILIIVVTIVGALAVKYWKPICTKTQKGYYYLFNREKWEDIEHRDVISHEKSEAKSDEESKYERLLKMIDDQLDKGLISKNNHQELEKIYKNKLDNLKKEEPTKPENSKKHS